MAFSTAALRSPGGLSRRPRSSQQTRSFRLALWSSYLDPNYQKELRRRHRNVRHKYIEALNRKLSWDRQLPEYARNLGFKSFMCSTRLGGRWGSIDPFDDIKDKPKKNPENGIEDVEENAFEKLFGRRDATYGSVQVKSRLFRPRRGHTGFPFDQVNENTSTDSSNGAKENSNGDARGQGNSSSYQEYEIDPITNRKVFKNTTNNADANHLKPIEVPVKTFKGYRSQFSGFEPRTRTTEAESTSQDFSFAALKKKNEEALDQLFDTSHCKQADSEHADPTKKRSKEYDTHTSYDQPFATYGFSQKIPEKVDLVQDGLKTYDSKISYDKPFMAYEADGQPPAESKPDPVQEGLKAYDAKIFYDKSFPAHKSDGKSPTREVTDPIKEGLKPFDVKMSYDKPFVAYEPDGQPPVEEASEDSGQEGLKVYDSKMSYDKPFMAYEPDGQHPQEEPPDSAWESIKEYEPDKRVSAEPKPDPVRESLKAYERKYPYPGSQAELKSKDTKPDDRDSVEEALEGYDGRPSPGPVYDNEYLGKPSDPVQASEAHKPSESLRPNRGSVAESISRRQMLDTAFDQKQGTFKLTPQKAQAAQQLREMAGQELQNQTSVVKGLVDSKTGDVKGQPANPSPRKMTGNFVQDFPEEFKAKWTPSKTSSGTLVPEEMESSQQSRSQSPNATKQSPQDFENKIQNSEKDYIIHFLAASNYSRRPDTPRLQTSLDRDIPRSSLSRNETTSRSKQDAELPQSSSVKAVAHQGEGDLSELVSSYRITRGEQNSAQPVAPPKSLRDIFASHTTAAKESDSEGDSEGQEPVWKSFAHRAEAAAAKHKNSDGREPAKNQNSQGLVSEAQSIYEDTYGTIDYNHRQNPLAASTKEADSEATVEDVKPAPETQEPTIYKILAYDPTMQIVSIAETTSIVPDSASPLTPAEVLERLSNPAKFFPCFEQLQSQGYEILSGSGDVLVFRKVRPATQSASRSEPSPAPQDPKRASTNPIDGMQSSPVAATGNFASPTGFVNHDLPIKSNVDWNIDVRREEPVFSGKRKWYDKDELHRRKTPGLGRRLVTGAVWVSACAYSIGVVAEYFKTGGSDGLGPQGF
jgi:hypothetical protein